mgnify:CR=1 FL=1
MLFRSVDIFGNVLLGFAAVSLFVSAFLIFNTFAIIVSQRMRELALLRAVGASPRQIRTMILGESLVVSILATLLGIVAGMGVAKGIVAIFNAAGAAFPSASLILSTRTIVASAVVGIGVTVAAAIVPALRASRIPPVAAMRPELGFDALQKSKRLVVGTVTTVVGAILFSIGVFVQPGGTSGTLGSSAIGAVLLFLGIASLSTTIAARASAVISRVLPVPFRPMTRSVPGRLGSRNAQRTPRRTASTASALMIGLALVSTVSVVASSVQASFTEQLKGSVTADFFVSDGPGSFQGLPVTFAERLAALPELSAVSPFRATVAQVNGETKTLGAVNGAAFGQLVDIGPGAAEHQRRPRRLQLEDAGQRGGPIGPAHHVRLLHHPGGAARGPLRGGDLDALGVTEVTADHPVDTGRHGGREQHRLTLGRGLLEDRLDVLGETPLEHLVGLVEDHGDRKSTRLNSSH